MLDDLPIPVNQSLNGTHSIKVVLPAAADPLQLANRHAVELMPLLFGLGLAVVLPPDAVIAPPAPIEPVVRAEPLAVIGAEAVAATLGRPTVAVGSGHVFLDEVDQRLTGLMVRLNAYRVTDAPTVLVSTGLVIAADTPSVGLRATAHELWELAKETLDRRGQICHPVAGLGDGALLVLHGGRTAQVAWLTAGRLATVSVTSLQDDTAWAIASATTIARLAGEQRDRGHLGCRGVLRWLWMEHSPAARSGGKRARHQVRDAGRANDASTTTQVAILGTTGASRAAGRHAGLAEQREEDDERFLAKGLRRPRGGDARAGIVAGPGAGAGSGAGP